MITFRFALVALAAVFLSVSPCAAGDTPKKLWELTGFERPESTLPDAKAGVIYVSNVAGNPTDKDGNGYISKVSLAGKLIAKRWVDGLNAPKGMIVVGDNLYVSDIDRLVVIDIPASKIAATYPAKGAKFLNDPAADASGNVYVSDLTENAIWRLTPDGVFEQWLATENLINPNGLYVEGDTLIVAAWGAMKPDWSTEIPGRLLKVSLADKSIAPLGDGSPVGNLDGLEPFGSQHFIVSDWMSGGVFKVARSGAATKIISLAQGSADLGYVPDQALLVVPMMNDGTILAYKLTAP